MYRLTAGVVVLCIISSYAKKIPNYIKPCSISDPKFEQCMIKHGHDAIPYILKGDREYNIPNFQPLKIDKVEFNAGSLKIKFDNMEVTGLENSKLLGARLDTAKEAMYFTLFVPRANVNAHYETKGRILLLPFEGSGRARVSLFRSRFNCSVYCENLRPGSSKPIIFKNSVVVFTAEDSKYNFENLFNGNKQLGDAVNKILNENHESLYEDFHPVFAETVNSVIKSIVTGIIQDMYFKDAFLP